MKEGLPGGRKEVLLKDIFEIKKGKKVNITENKNNESIPYVGIKNLRGTPISQYSSDKNGLICDENDLLLVWDGANCGTVGTGMSGYVGSTIARLRLNDSLVNVDYAYRFLKYNFKYFNSTTTGATIPHLDKKNVHGLKIPLPPLPTQKKIAGILEKAEKLKTWRAEADKLTDEFLKSTFLEMFGDPVKNPMGWTFLKFAKVGSLKRGKSKHRPRDAPELLGGPYPLIQTGSVANSGGYIRKYHQTYSELGLSQSKMWPVGTLCITIAANIAKTGILMFDSCFPDSIVGFTPNETVRTEYVQYWLSFLQKMLEETAPESAQKNINLEILSNLNIPLPPLPLQQKFAEIVRQVEQMRQYQQESKAHIDDLFNALMQKAFKGELVA